MYYCKFCNKSFEKGVMKRSHEFNCGFNPERITDIECRACKIKFCLINRRDRIKSCSDKCKNYISEEHKLSISNGIKKYLKNNPDKHVWKRSDKFKSIPCENVKIFLNKNFFRETVAKANKIF